MDSGVGTFPQPRQRFAHIHVHAGITLHQTTAYNSAANGMVERFHRTLKAAFGVPRKDSNWFTKLPWVFLEIRTTPKDNLDVSAAEMVHGDPLVVDTELFPFAIVSDNLQHLLHVVVKFTPCRQTYMPPAKQHIQTDLHSATQVFLCNDTRKPPLTPHYTSPFLVIHQTLKALLNIRGKEPVYILTDDQPTASLSRAGCPISHIIYKIIFKVTL
ncbi:uncharacterized protein [Palaemon carinicauda]|uniref:uncharacterized protein n=1 Tax=Palaemon carinicauda TaxID=392227 RepID=UPI0035B57B4E